MLTQARLRTIVRGSHIGGGVLLIAYVVSGFHRNAIPTSMAQAVVLSLVIFSGVWMWQQGRIARWMRGTPSPKVDTRQPQ